jgi:hypothetical protein
MAGLFHHICLSDEDNFATDELVQRRLIVGGL